MAFISAVAAPLRTASLRAAATSFRGARLSTARVNRAVVVARPAAPCMAASGKYPPSEVLGIGKDIPSSLFLLSSVAAFLLGCYSVYLSNFVVQLSYANVNPQYIAGSLLLPISWGLHVAGFIQQENGK